MRRYVQGFALLGLCIMAVTASCRRTQPSLIDRNQPPDTQLWYAPPDSSDYEYKVHMYWRGVDGDGTTPRFIWAILDTIAAGEASWNPATRLRDYRAGRITSRTDSVFSFKAYKDVDGVGVRKNRQAFFVAAIDDNGVIDPQPAAVEFVATIGRLPEMRFTNHIGGVKRPYTFSTPPRDTVGMYAPFAISYHGVTVNGQVRGYQYFPLSTSIVVPGSGVWTSNLTDTLRTFANTVANPIPAGAFRFAAKCIDDAGAESQVDGSRYRTGVSTVVVNFDPDTWITDARYSMFYSDPNKTFLQRPINFTDNVPDTVPNRAWVTVYYDARDDSRDTRLCSVADPDQCIDYRIRVIRSSARFHPSGYDDSNWWPPSPALHDHDPNSTADSNSVSISTFEYDIYPSGVDENGSNDGTPPRLHIVGNYDPTLDTFTLEDHLGNPVNTSGPIDTLEWDFHKGIGWPYDAASDTTQSDGVYFKEFGFRFRATGHDDARDQDGAAIRAWNYKMYTGFQSLSNPGTFVGFGRGGLAFIPSDAGNNQVDELAKNKYRYFYPDGSDIFTYGTNNLSFVNQVVTLVVFGRDTPIVAEAPVDQVVFYDAVVPGSNAGNGTAESRAICTTNTFNVSEFGRWTQPKVVQFYLRFKHPGGAP